jgi:L-ascorbate metabolism protein UlaG (beta-lactamase superfamily)
MKKNFLLLLITLSLLAACNNEASKLATDKKSDSVKQENALILPSVGNSTGKVQIQTVSSDPTYPFNSYIITSTKGEAVVVDPTQMPKKEIVDINPAAIVNTHIHPDHVDKTFTDSYECKTLYAKKGEVNTADFHIYSILSSHDSDTINENTGNKIIVFEVDGLRIAHLGDIGQTFLTDEQLKDLGKIDIAFMQFENSYSAMSVTNEKGFKLIEQLNPKIIIPTHYTTACLPVLEQKYGSISKFDNMLSISKDNLPEKPLTVYQISNTHKYK